MKIQIRSDPRVSKILISGAPGPAGPPGAPGPPGPPGGEVFVFHQDQASSVWIVNHGLGRRPIVLTYTEGWMPMVATIVHTSENQFQVHLSAPSKGYVLYS